MKRCPKCQSSMVLEMASVTNGWTENWGRVWKCICCGREIPENPALLEEEPEKQRVED